MLRSIVSVALTAAGLAAVGLAGAAQAHEQGYGGARYEGAGGYEAGYGYGPTPAYAADEAYGRGYDYAPYRPRRFTLAGARAGFTVLGVDVDGSAKLTLGAHGWGGGHGSPRRTYAPPPPRYEPEPEPVYAEPAYSYPQPSYRYGYPSYSYGYPSYGYSYGCCVPPPPCGC